MKEKKAKDKKPKDKKSKDEMENLTPEPKHTEDFDSEDKESALDGCDLEVTEADITLDADLPKTEGGVA